MQTGPNTGTTTGADDPVGIPWAGLITIGGVSIYPFAAFVAENRHEGLGLGRVAPFAAGVLLLGLVVVAVAWRLRGARGGNRVAIMWAVLLLATVNFGALAAALEPVGLRTRYELAIWAGILAAALGLSWWASARSAVRDWVMFSAILLAAIPLAQVAVHRFSVGDAAPMASAASSGLERTPDIYFLVPDGYARADLLRSSFDFDNTSFFEHLEDRGFVVADEAYANFSTTYLSIPSTLQMEYVVEPGPEALTVHADGQRFDRSRFYDIIKSGSTLVRTLREAGYAHVQAPPGNWSGSACSGDEDLCIEPLGESGADILLGELEWALLELTPAATLLAGLGETFDDVTSDPVHTLREIERHGVESPVFAFIHMLHPHPPFRFDGRCGAIDAGGRSLGNWHEEAREAYVDGVRCTNRRIEEMLELLPAEAVVVIQADHGPNFLRGTTTPVGSWSDEQVRERLSILSAIRLPEDCREHIEPNLAGVNTFRLVLACLRGEEPDLLPDRHFLAPDRGDPEVREVDGPFS